MYDIFFISYNEPTADDNWSRLFSRFPAAKRVNGITGINNAHAVCAAQTVTKLFWTVDADTIVDDNFAFDYVVMPWDEKYLHVWYSRNPINGLEYGYGSIKLWPNAVAKNKTSNWLDFTTSVGKIKIIEQTVSTTKFDTDLYSSWKSGFREAVKLSQQVYVYQNSQAAERLVKWTTFLNDNEFSKETVKGVGHGIAYFLQHWDCQEQLKLINDFEWLYAYYIEIVDQKETNSTDALLKKLGIKNV